MRFLQYAEDQLALYCLSELDLGPQLEELFELGRGPKKLGSGGLHGHFEADGRLSPVFARRLWGPWYGREEELYRACAALVRDMEWTDLHALGRIGFGLAAKRLRAAHTRAFSEELPAVLCKGHIETVSEDDSTALVRGINAPYDPIQLSTAELTALDVFDGRPTAEVLPLLAREHGIDRARVERFFRHSLIVPPRGGDLPPAERPQGPLTQASRLMFFRGYLDSNVTAEEGVVDGTKMFVLKCGVKQVDFDEPELFEFARQLVAHQNGFDAAEAAEWGQLGWEKVEPLLEALLADSVLQRVA
jgi:hypothetical protein